MYKTALKLTSERESDISDKEIRGSVGPYVIS